uniref:F-box domain-containing protein n=1 Tax=Parastrongyloides trichosuri TaxID=131310 RepID=A0A0N4ZRA8_PARTI
MSLMSLPDEAIVKILGYLGTKDLNNVKKVSRSLYNMCYENIHKMQRFEWDKIHVSGAGRIGKCGIEVSFLNNSEYYTREIDINETITFRNLIKYVTMDGINSIIIDVGGPDDLFFKLFNPFVDNNFRVDHIYINIYNFAKSEGLFEFLSRVNNFKHLSVFRSSIGGDYSYDILDNQSTVTVALPMNEMSYLKKILESTSKNNLICDKNHLNVQFGDDLNSGVRQMFNFINDCNTGIFSVSGTFISHHYSLNHEQFYNIFSEETSYQWSLKEEDSDKIISGIKYCWKCKKRKEIFIELK